MLLKEIVELPSRRKIPDNLAYIDYDKGYNHCLKEIENISVEIDDAKLIEILMEPSKSKDVNVNIGIINKYQARFLANAIINSNIFKKGEV